jgi:hypothetical protein
MEDLPEISKAFELRPGAIYAIECDAFLSGSIRLKVADIMARWEERTKCKFILLEAPFHMVEPPQRYRATSANTAIRP